MIGLAHQPTETELNAHRRRIAFRKKIAAQAAALNQPPDPAKVLPIEVEPAQVEEIPPTPRKAPWFKVENITCILPYRIREIQEVVCEYFGQSMTDLTSQRRRAQEVRSRQVAMYLAKVMTGRSLPEIGRRFGGRDHTTVLHAVRKIGGKVEFNADAPELFDVELSDLVTALREEIEARHHE